MNSAPAKNQKKEFIHFHLINSVAQAIDEVFHNGRYADRVIEKYFKANRKWGARDRKFVAEAIYEIVRNYRKLQYIANSDRTFDILGVYLLQTRGEIPSGRPEFNEMDIAGIKARSNAAMPVEVSESFPDWMNELGQQEFGNDWPKLMRALNQPAEVFLRVNTLKATPEKAIKSLQSEEIDARPVESKEFQFPVALKLAVRKNVFITQAFKSGFFEMQDAASQLVAELVDPKPGDRLVDACAGAGGKSLHLAALMQNKGKIISMDIHEWKLKELKTRAARGGVDIIETKIIEGSKTIKRLENSFDRILLDVPCSGMGVLRRNPDTKWKLTLEEIQRLQDLQRQILSDYSKMAKPGSTMVYATCSILKRENEEQVKWFLGTSAGKDWSLEKELRVWPHIHGFDGFYGARLRKK